jgi:hypothetical protein
MTERTPDAPNAGSASRRAVLRLGAVAIPAVVTLKPAFAAAPSVMNCEIPVDKWVDAYGNPTTAGAEDAFAPPSRPYLGDEVRSMSPPSISLADGNPMSQQAFNAHVEYIKNMQRGTPGFTCFASIAARRIA